jgi:hypothetical protein
MSGCGGQSGFHCTGSELCPLPFEERLNALPSVNLSQLAHVLCSK